jgi:penicillin-binding protein 1A
MMAREERLAERDGIWSRHGTNVEELPDPFAPIAGDFGPAGEADQAPQPKRRRWPIVLYSISGLLLLTLVWLIVTAPLSRALEPLDDPAMLLVSADGHPIARRGAVKESPVDVTKLAPLTPAAFFARAAARLPSSSPRPISCRATGRSSARRRR